MTDAARRLRLSIEFEHGADPIAGDVSCPDGRRLTFVGWVDLTTVLEDALNDYGRADASAVTPTGDEDVSE